jgi:outer membrane protein TolC
MRNAHEPDDQFTARLDEQIRRDIRRRHRAAAGLPWMLRSRRALALAAAGLMLISMGVGAAVVAAAYEAQDSELRGQLTRNYTQRADLAKQRFALVSDEVREVERRLSVGAADNQAVGEARLKMADAEAQVRIAQLLLQEVAITGRDPRSELSAPRVGGRDFVGERLRVEMSVPERALAIEQARLRDLQARVEIGVGTLADLAVSQVRVAEIELALQAFKARLEIRQKFLSGGVDAVETDLRGLEAGSDRERRTLQRRIELAKTQLQTVQSRVEVGLATNVELTEAQLKLQELSTDLVRVDLDLAIIRRKIQDHRRKV